jgi:hypothetical protein
MLQQTRGVSLMQFLKTAAVVLMIGLMTSSPVTAKCKHNPGAGFDWHGCNMQMVILEETDLTGANLEGAFLSGTVFTGSRLTQANLQGAELVRTSFDKADLRVRTWKRRWRGGRSSILKC